jgi:4-amino-4-deoxy-L-arabinose transferase-like glycosyltransferase
MVSDYTFSAILRLMTVRVRPGSVALVATCALALRLLYLLELRDTPLFSVLIGDGRQYVAWAREIAGGQWIGTAVFYQAPLYPYLLALVFKLAGTNLLIVRLLQAVLGAASCVLLARAGRRFFNERVGLVAGWLLAVYPPAIFFDGLIQKPALDLFLVCLTLALLGEFMTRRGSSLLVGAGLALGALALNRENARVLYPIVAVWLCWFFRETPARTRAAWVAAFTAAMLAMTVPVGLRNYHVGGEFLVSTSQFGPNFYIGNHAGARGSYEPLMPNHGNVAFERDDATQLAEKASGRRLSPGEVSDYWVHRALNDIRAQPLGWLRLLGRKLLLTFNATELVDTESIEVYAEYSRVLGTLFWLNFGILLPLAAIGAWETRAGWRRLAVLYAVVGALALSVALFYVLARYRYPVVPVVLLFAAAALCAVPTSIRGWRQWAPGLALAGVVAIVAHLPLSPSADETFLNLGTALISDGRPVEAIPMLERAVASAPNYAAPHFNLGVALDRIGEKQKALAEFSTAVTLRPDDGEAQGALGLTLRETGRTGDALTAFETAVRLSPDSAPARGNLALALLEVGRRDPRIPGGTPSRSERRLAAQQPGGCPPAGRPAAGGDR